MFYVVVELEEPFVLMEERSQKIISTIRMKIDYTIINICRVACK